MQEAGTALAEYSRPQLRYSISWKAYCFSGAKQEALWREGSDNLTLIILDTLEAELRSRGVLSGPRPGPTEFALLLVQNFVHYPDCTETA